MKIKELIKDLTPSVAIIAFFFVFGLILTKVNPNNLKPARDVCAEKGGLYINATCIKVERIDLGE